MKKNAFKKFLALMLVAAMAVSTIACGGDKKEELAAETPAETSAEAPAETPAEEEAEVNFDETMEVSWLGVPRFGSGEEGGYAETLLEETYNLKITPMFFDQEGYADKKSVTLLGGTIPDLLYEMDPSHVQNDVDQGFIQEVPFEMIAKYAPDYYEFINKYCPEAWLYCNVDGKNYGLPNLNYSGNIPYAGVWRTDWLANVGIDKIPETLDEFYEAMYKFAKEDPDGNGKDDTYGMTNDINTFHMMFAEFFGAYGASPFTWVYAEDGTVQYGGLQDNVKEALTTLAKWYNEGLIHPDFISDSCWNADRFKNGEVGYMQNNGAATINDEANENSLINKVRINCPEATVENATMPVGPNGDQGRFVWGLPQHVVSFGVNCDEAKLIRLLTIMNDIIADNELNFKLHMGDESRWESDEKAGITMKKDLDPSNASMGLADTATGHAFFAPVVSSFEYQETYLTDAVKEYRAQYTPTELGIADIFNKTDVVPSAASYLTDVRTQQISIMTKIIRGEENIDFYDTFAAYWEANGGAEMTAEAQAMGAVLDNIYTAVGVSK